MGNKEIEQDGSNFKVEITRREFLTLPMETRRRILSEQVNLMSKEQIDALYQPVSARPKIVCLCGSTRFSEAFQQAQLDETVAGRIVLTIGCNLKSDDALFGTGIYQRYSPNQIKNLKSQLDELHLRKIELADEVLILNVGGYIGESTKKELEYARQNNKTIRFLEACQ